MIHDIFENSSPKRLLDHNRGTLGNSSVDDIVTSPVKISRKRVHGRLGDHGLAPPGLEHRDDMKSLSKRQRSELWHGDEDLENIPPNVHDGTAAEASPVKPSRFHEASMHDRPSNQPPSMFMRTAMESAEGIDIDMLMEEYDEEKRSPSKWNRRRTRAETRKKDFTLHPNMSITSTATTGSRRSGIFRFGRSFVSSFVPTSKFRSNSDHHADSAGPDSEALSNEASQQKAKEELKKRAEQTYAEMKQAGQLSKKGFSAQLLNASGGAVESTTVTSPQKSATQEQTRDDKRSKHSSHQEEVNQLEDSGIKLKTRSSFHFRTPSLSNLKKLSSSSNLHHGSSAMSLSPKKRHDEVKDASTTPKKPGQEKHTKLQKRVSNLESKLEAARRELRTAMDDTPSVPPVPPILSIPAASTNTARPPLPKRKPVPRSRTFAPLPSLPSESLLNAGNTFGVPEIIVQDAAEYNAPTARRPVSGDFNGSEKPYRCLVD